MPAKRFSQLGNTVGKNAHFSFVVLSAAAIFFLVSLKTTKPKERRPFCFLC